MTFDSQSREKMDRAWLNQLQYEYAAICRQRRVSLSPPVFELSESERDFGSYDPHHRVMRLSRRLIRNYAWNVTLQVLRHEMAHQMCAESSLPVSSPHGVDFQAACEILGVDPAYRRAGIMQQSLVDAAADSLPETDDGRRCLMRVEKLLALAGSGNEHEAELAMQKAHELMEKHHLDGLSLPGKRIFTRRTIELKRKRLAVHIRRICSILQGHFHVQLVIADLYCAGDDTTYKVLDIFGTPENVAIAEYCYFFLEERLAYFWEQNHQQFSGKRRTEKTSFYLGLLTGFSERLANQRGNDLSKNLDEQTRALVVAEDRRLQQYVAGQYERLTCSRSKATKVYSATFASGQETGRMLTLVKPVTGSSSRRGGFITCKVSKNRE